MRKTIRKISKKTGKAYYVQVKNIKHKPSFFATVMERARELVGAK